MRKNLILVLTTEENLLNAKKLANKLLGNKLAACISMRRITSSYWWNGNLEDSNEYQLMIKTTKDKLASLMDEIKCRHSYDLPEIIFWEVNSSDEYHEWVNASLID